MQRECLKCGLEKDENQFPFRKSRKGVMIPRNECKACTRLAMVVRVAKDPQKKKDYAKMWVHNNRVRHNANSRKNRPKYKDYFKQYAANWAKNNKEKRCAYSAKRRALKMGSGGSWTKEDIKNLYVLQRGCCVACLKELNGKYEIDHRIALSQGGTNHFKNLDLLCSRCNQQKHNKYPIDFMRTKGWLL